jgi:hypothetical protein
MIAIAALALFQLAGQFDNAPYAPTRCTPSYYRFSLLKHASRFLIHGLWIEECSECATCGYPSGCGGAHCALNVSSLRPLFTQLHANWYPACPAENNSLLTHEWCKHGTCTNQTALEYFNTSLTLYGALLRRGMFADCDPTSKECYFVVDGNLTIANNTWRQ